MDDNEQVIMYLISLSRDARSKSIEAIRAARRNDFGKSP